MKDIIKMIKFIEKMGRLLFTVLAGVSMWVTMTPVRKKYHASFDDYDSNVSSSSNDWGI